MREIKFKFWNKEKKHWEDDLLKTSPDYQNPFMRDDIISVQYMGLKDKNGKEIYEGDIFQIQFKGDDKQIFQVEWCAGDIYAGWNIGEIDAKNGEIIGNIYKNLDLLEK